MDIRTAYGPFSILQGEKKKKEIPDLTQEVKIKKDIPFILHPGEFALGSTLEKLTLSNDIVSRIEGKSSLGRLGLLIHSTAGFIDPGWDGNLTLELANVSRLPITLYYGMRIGQISFQEMTTGVKIQDAIIKACQLRIRPIIMTSLSTMIAMLPLVIGNIGPGAGEGSRLAVGSTILGGMIISTFFTLYVTPTMYLALAKNTKRIDAVDIELKKQLN